MPSEESGRDSDPRGPSSVESPASGDRRASSADPPSGPFPPSSNGRPPAEFVAWGAVRDAITSIHNLESLLKSPRVGTKVLAEVLHEFLTGISVLREAFLKAGASAKSEAALEARGALGEFARGKLDELGKAMQAAMVTDFDARGRLGLEQVVMRVSVDLDAAAELLDLSERAEAPLVTELPLDELARVALRGGARGTDREVAVRLAMEPHHDCLLRTDPHVFKRLVAFAVSRLHAAGAAEVTIRASCEAEHAQIDVGPTLPEDGSLRATSLRLVRRLDPTDAIVDAAARSAGVVMTVCAAAAVPALAAVSARSVISFRVPLVVSGSP